MSAETRRNLKINLIRTDGGTQPRTVLNFDVIELYTDAMEAGATFPPVDVFYDGTNYWLADGFHRIRAVNGCEHPERDEFACTVHQGTQEDAQWFSFAANKSNGLYRSNQDKQRAVQAALKHPKSKGLSDSAIAKHVGVSQHCVSDWRAKLEPSKKVSKIATRTATRAGKTYEINTANIGRTAAKPAGAPPVISRERSATPAPQLQPIPVSVPKGFDADDLGQVDIVVLSCRAILDNHLSAKDLGILIKRHIGGTDCAGIFKEVCEYLQEAIGAAASLDAVRRH